ncbi:MAG: ribosomal protein S6, partial [Marinomonas primoryensis]
EKQKLFNVYRRNLDDVSWEEREYPYKITHQKAGDFLVIDVSATDYPEVTSFHLVQRFVN